MKLKNVADIYPLGPLQEGILFHVVADQHAEAIAITSSSAQIKMFEFLDIFIS